VLTRLADAIELIEGAPPAATDEVTIADHLGRFALHDFWITFVLVLDRFPVPMEVRRLSRSFQLDGVPGVVERLRSRTAIRGDEPTTVVSDVDLIDVTGVADGSAHGAEVGRRLVSAWAGDALPVVWNADGRVLRTLTVDEAVALGVPTPAEPGRPVVPYRSRYVIVGAVTHPRSAERVVALGIYSQNETGSVGYGLEPLLDPVPIEIRHDAEDRFSWHLAGQRSLERLAVVGAPEREYRGWVQMLAAVGLQGPRIEAFELPQDDDEGWAALARVVGAQLGLSARVR